MPRNNFSRIKSVFLFFFSLCSLVYAEFPPTYIYKLAPGEVFFKFDFEDLAGKRWTSQNLRGKPIVILTGHRYLRYDIREWARALKKDFSDKEKITLLWVANPSRLRWETLHENVIAEWKDFDAPIPLIPDWHSQIGRSLKIFYNSPNIIGIDSTGKLIFHDTLTCTKENFLLISEKIKRMCDKVPPFP